MQDGMLARKKVKELREIAESIGIDHQGLRKGELIDAIQGITAGEPSHSQDEAPNGAEREGDATPRARKVTQAEVEDTEDEDDERGDDGDEDGAETGAAALRRQRRELRAQKRLERERQREEGRPRQGRDATRDATRDNRDTPRDTNTNGNGNTNGSNRDNGNGYTNGKGNRDYGSRDTARDARSPRKNKEDQEPIRIEIREGVLDILPEGYGFMRTTGFLPGPKDVYVSQGQVRKYDLRKGDIVQGPIKQQRSNDKVPALDGVDSINGVPVVNDETPAEREAFNHIPALRATEPLNIGNDTLELKLGERILFDVPKSDDELVMLSDMTNAIHEHNDNLHVMVISVDERPEEMTILTRAVKGDVIASTFDRSAEDHVQVAELALARAKCMVELGSDVVVILRSVPRLAKSFAIANGTQTRLVGAGVESGFVFPTKRWFGQGRNLEDHGSLTIIGFIDTLSTLDIDQTINQLMVEMANQVVHFMRDDQGNYVLNERA